MMADLIPDPSVIHISMPPYSRAPERHLDADSCSSHNIKIRVRIDGQYLRLGIWNDQGELGPYTYAKTASMDKEGWGLVRAMTRILPQRSIEGK